jgi:hypothetical protein
MVVAAAAVVTLVVAAAVVILAAAAVTLVAAVALILVEQAVQMQGLFVLHLQVVHIHLQQEAVTQAEVMPGVR